MGQKRDMHLHYVQGQQCNTTTKPLCVYITITEHLSLVPRPLPPEERPGTHCLCMCKIFRYIFRIKLCALPCSYTEIILIKNTELSLFSDNLTCRTLLG